MTTTVYYQIQSEWYIPNNWSDVEAIYGRSNDFDKAEQRIETMKSGMSGRLKQRYRIVKVTREVLNKVY